jgi:hypothetical protein
MDGGFDIAAVLEIQTGRRRNNGGQTTEKRNRRNPQAKRG